MSKNGQGMKDRADDYLRERSESPLDPIPLDSADLVAFATDELELAGHALALKRERLPDERHSVTHKFRVGGHKGYVTVGHYEDGRPAELFLRMHKQGSTMSGMCDSFATMTSIALQYGVPLKDLCRKFIGAKFEPQGVSGHEGIREASSIVDYIFRWLALKYLTLEERTEIGMRILG